MVHEVFDLPHWAREFSLARLRAEARQQVLAQAEAEPGRFANPAAIEERIECMSPSPTSITGPVDLAQVEQLRAECPSLQSQPKVAVDVFVFGVGEGPRREATRVGGLPYRPAALEWPTDPEGEPLTFVAQFCFADSRDIVGETPGDVLLLFLPRTWEGSEWEELDGYLHTEWYPLGLQDLVRPEQVPPTEWAIRPCYGVRHRSWDCPESGELLQEVEAGWLLGCFEGTKIGGAPRWVQWEEDLPGRYLCCLGSIRPSWKHPYPWINRAEPLVTMEEAFGDDLLMWGDAGVAYLFLGEDGRVHWTEQHY